MSALTTLNYEWLNLLDSESRSGQNPAREAPLAERTSENHSKTFGYVSTDILGQDVAKNSVAPCKFQI